MTTLSENDLVVVNAYMALFQDRFERPTVLTPEQVKAIVLSIQGEGEDVDTARLDAMEDAEPEDTGDAPAPQDAASAIALLSDAERLGLKFAADEGFAANLVESLKAGDKKKREAVDVLCDMFRVVGADQITTVFPVPRSEAGKEGAGNFVDRFQEQDAEGAWKWTSFFQKWADVQPPVVEAIKKLALIEDAIKGVASEANPYQAKSAPWLESEKARLSGWRTGTAGLARKAVNVWRQLEAITTLLPKVSASLQWETENDDDGKPLPLAARMPVRTNKPLYIQDRNSPTHVKALGVSSFLALKVEAAVKTGGTYAALLATIGRKPKSGQGSTVAAVKMPANVPTLVSYMQMTSQYLDYQDADGAKRVASFVASCQGEKGEDNVVAVLDLYRRADYLMSVLGDRATLVAAKRSGDIKGDAADILARHAAAQAVPESTRQKTAAAFAAFHNSGVKAS